MKKLYTFVPYVQKFPIIGYTIYDIRNKEWDIYSNSNLSTLFNFITRYATEDFVRFVEKRQQHAKDIRL